MATAYENAVKHLELAVREMQHLKPRESCADEDELLDLVYQINGLLLEFTN